MHPDVERARERLPDTWQRLVTTAREKEILLYAGGLAFYGLVSVAPFVVISFWIAGAFVDDEQFSRLGENIDEYAPGGADFGGAIESLAQVRHGIGVGALFAALWPATAYGSGLVRAFDRIAERPERNFKGVHGRVRALVFVVLLPLFVLGALGASFLATTVFDDGWLAMLGAWTLAVVAAFVAGTIVHATIYELFGPDRLGPRAVLQGAAAAAAGIAAMSLGYVIYLGEGADFEEQVAGSGFAAVVLLALWLYLANVILLVGYTLARSCAGSTGDPGEGGEPS